MEKKDLLNFIDDGLLEKLYGFCYARTNDSYEAEALCSDIVFALVKAAGTEGTIDDVYPFIWKVARNVYADFSEKRSRRTDLFDSRDPEEALCGIAAAEKEDMSETLSLIFRRIAFLTKAYREVMIAFYLDGFSTAAIARRLSVTESTVRQRLFSARQKIRSEVEEMTDKLVKPVALDNINFVFWGNGMPSWGDPRMVCTRQFSRHIVWLCRKKAKSASEIAAELNVPTVYVEEELEILTKGENGEYGLLRRLDNGKYAINFVLLEKDVFDKATSLYTARIPEICDAIIKYIEKHKDEYLAFPYLNKKVDLNLILWQQIRHLASVYCNAVCGYLEHKYFRDVKKPDRPFTVYGYEDHGVYFGGGCDGANAYNLCGYSEVHVENIYITRIRKHFSFGVDISNDPQLQLAIRAIEGVSVNALTEKDKEHAAKAIESGYIYRDGDMLYTKILVSDMKDRHLFDLSYRLDPAGFAKEAEDTADKLAALFRKAIPDYLMGEWGCANALANGPVLDAVVDCLIEKGMLVPPENGIGAEGCYMFVSKNNSN